MAESPFADAERAAGAVWTTIDGIDVPERYGDPFTEAAAARAGAALVDLSHRSRLHVLGPDRTSFLHNLLSNDVQSLRPGTGCYATALTQQSRVVADLNVLCDAEEIVLEVLAGRKDRLREHLEKYLVAEDVEIEDRSAEEATLGVHGPRAAEILGAALDGASLPQGELGRAGASLAGTPVCVVRVVRTGDPGFDLWIPRAAASATWRALAGAGEPFGLRPIGAAALEILRIEAGIPVAGIDFDESHLVLEAGLERGIHFRKGCYLGQEVVERQSARGHVNRKRVGLRIEGRTVPAPGAAIRDGANEVGAVTSAALSPTLDRAIAMGYVRREAMDPGRTLEIDSASGSLAAVVVAMPFVETRR